MSILTEQQKAEGILTVRVSDDTRLAEINTSNRFMVDAEISNGTDNPVNVIITGVDKTSFSGVDGATEVLETMSYEHHEVHSGSHFFLATGDTLANAETSNFLIVTQDTTKWAHMHFLFSAGLGAKFELYRGSDRTPGLQVMPENSNQNSIKTSGTLFYATYSGGTTDGKLIATFLVGSSSVGGKIGGAGRSEEEIVLKQNEQYTLRSTSQANANNISTFATFYEHTDKN